MVTGGIDVESGFDEDQLDEHGVREPQIYDPYRNRWRTVNEPSPIGSEHGSKHAARNYHSVALLMPDGRVWSAGSSINHKDGVDNANLDIDLFAPWYHGNPDRPEITDAPSWAATHETFEVRSTFADEIERVVLVRCGSCTHAFNSDHRLIELEFKQDGDDLLKVKMPANNFIMPPGPYMIFSIRERAGTPGNLGLPSFGTDIHIRPCVEYGQPCTSSAQCCNDVPCINGRCRYP
jgi:hypothetical protein